MTIENQRPLDEFQLIGFAISFELDYFNVLDILQMGRIPICCHERSENDPIVIAGGPCATFNPEPLTPFIMGTWILPGGLRACSMKWSWLSMTDR